MLPRLPYSTEFNSKSLSMPRVDAALSCSCAAGWSNVPLCLGRTLPPPRSILTACGKSCSNSSLSLLKFVLQSTNNAAVQSNCMILNQADIAIVV